MIRSDCKQIKPFYFKVVRDIAPSPAPPRQMALRSPAVTWWAGD